ncbi:MAG: HNH endonuclease [Saccharofermentans sp.]|nr:HNH endonuclease [Saccharofermentans sp.]
MYIFEDISSELESFLDAFKSGEVWGSGQGILILILVVLLAAVLIALLVVGVRYKRQQRSIRRQEMMRSEIAGRRRIRVADKNEVFDRDNYTCQICGISKGFLDSLCDGLGDYLLLEADHIQSVSQGGTGRDIDNLQCLCWRCNRKKGGNKTNDQVRKMIDYGIDYLDTGDYE